jgi:hypothetical protein
VKTASVDPNEVGTRIAVWTRTMRDAPERGQQNFTLSINMLE